MITLTPRREVGRFALFYLGFRPFFLGATLAAVVTIALWVLMYIYAINPPWFVTSPMRWHAHEMLYGYALAVIAGFLLTAVKNWTGIQTLHRTWLAVLFGLWLGARLLALTDWLAYLLVVEALFLIGLFVAIAVPIMRARQWHQSLILAVLLLLMAGDTLYYLGVWYFQPQWQARGVAIGLYTILLLIFFMARRVVPFFIERGVDAKVSIHNYRWLDITTIVGFVVFAILDIWAAYEQLAALFAAGLFALHLYRLVLWHTPRLWSKPLLWGLYLAYVWLVAGFALKALAAFTAMSSTLALHAFAYGGIGLMTLAMMARVTLGHTGRDVAQPPAYSVPVALALVMLGAVVRVVLPILWPAQYPLWIGLSGALWIAGFLVFAARFTPMWMRPRIDGQYG